MFWRMIRPHLALVWLALLATAASWAAAETPVGPHAAPATVRVTLRTGQQFAGRVAQRTTSATLWMEWGHVGLSLSRPIPWHEVVAVHSASGEPLNLEGLRQSVARSSPAPAPPPAAEPARITLRSLNQGLATEPDVAHESAEHRPARTLYLSASVGNWDADAAADGLSLRLEPYDAHGQRVAVTGLVHVSLVGTRLRGEHHYGIGSRLEPVVLGQWTRSVTPELQETGGYWLRLPFRQHVADTDWTLGSHGLVHARLALPGEGVLEAVADGLRLRTCSPHRDLLQVIRGERFLPQERR